MKLTKQLKEEILRDYHVCSGAYLQGDMKTFASCLDDPLQTIGTAASEEFRNKQKALRAYKAAAVSLNCHWYSVRPEPVGICTNAPLIKLVNPNQGDLFKNLFTGQ